MHVSPNTAAERSWFLPALFCGCLFSSVLSGLLTIFLYVELRHGGEQIQDLKQLIAASKAESASCVHELRRVPAAAPWNAPAALPVTPLPMQTVSPRPSYGPTRVEAAPRNEKEPKADIPEDGKFVLVGEDGKNATSQERKFKLLSEK